MLPHNPRGDFREKAEPAPFPMLKEELAIFGVIWAVECQGQM
jgi:hypothetical protein